MVLIIAAVLHRASVEELDEDCAIHLWDDVVELMIRELHHHNFPNRRLMIL